MIFMFVNNYGLKAKNKVIMVLDILIISHFKEVFVNVSAKLR